jgi:hypothetical protein
MTVFPMFKAIGSHSFDFVVYEVAFSTFSPYKQAYDK